MVSDLPQLQKQISILQDENRILKERISFLEGHPTLSEGLRGEKLIQRIIGGALTTHTKGYDLELESGILIEIKMAKLNAPVKSKNSRRWAWGKIYGEQGNKKFHFLILAGHVDERFRSQYLDDLSPYVFFLIPYQEIMTFTTRTGKNRAIFLNTNPSSRQKKSEALFQKFQITTADLEKKFAL